MLYSSSTGSNGAGVYLAFNLVAVMEIWRIHTSATARYLIPVYITPSQVSLNAGYNYATAGELTEASTSIVIYAPGFTILTQGFLF